MAKELYGVLRRPVVTEKFTAIGEKRSFGCRAVMDVYSSARP